MNSRPSVVVFDYGSGNVRSAQRALEHVGAEVTLTSDFETALNADGLFVPGVGAFDACMQGINKFKGG
jgi:glutamine amidotransferase